MSGQDGQSVVLTQLNAVMKACSFEIWVELQPRDWLPYDVAFSIPSNHQEGITWGRPVYMADARQATGMGCRRRCLRRRAQRIDPHGGGVGKDEQACRLLVLVNSRRIGTLGYGREWHYPICIAAYQ